MQTSETKTTARKQQHLDGMAPPSIPDIDAAAESYADLRDQRMALLQREVAAKQSLLGLMKQHKQSTYRTADGIDVTVESKEETVKVKRPSANSDEGEEE